MSIKPEVEAYFRRRIRNPHVLERVLEANEDIQEGDLIRGWRRSQHRPLLLIGKREFIGRFGRAVWGALPRGTLWRYGKRRCVGLALAAQLNGALIPNEMVPRLGDLMRRSYPGNHYANDPVPPIRFMDRALARDWAAFWRNVRAYRKGIVMSRQVNLYGGTCKCGTEVLPGEGFMEPGRLTRRLLVRCHLCAEPEARRTLMLPPGMKVVVSSEVQAGHIVWIKDGRTIGEMTPTATTGTHEGADCAFVSLEDAPYA